MSKDDARVPGLSLRNRHPKPETRYPNPGTRNPKPETRNLKPETRNPKPETRNPKPETLDQAIKAMRYAENAKTEWESAEERRERLKQVATLTVYRVTSLIKKRPTLGPYSRLMPRALWGS